jgi:hypothetical protein
VLAADSAAIMKKTLPRMTLKVLIFTDRGGKCGMAAISAATLFDEEEADSGVQQKINSAVTPAVNWCFCTPRCLRQQNGVS